MRSLVAMLQRCSEILITHREHVVRAAPINPFCHRSDAKRHRRWLVFIS